MTATLDPGPFTTLSYGVVKSLATGKTYDAKVKAPAPVVGSPVVAFLQMLTTGVH